MSFREKYDLRMRRKSLFERIATLDQEHLENLELTVTFIEATGKKINLAMCMDDIEKIGDHQRARADAAASAA